MKLILLRHVFFKFDFFVSINLWDSHRMQKQIHAKQNLKSSELYETIKHDIQSK